MSLELVNTFGTLLTVAIIAATAIAAMVQLRHLRAGNQINAMLTIADELKDNDFKDALYLVRRNLDSAMQNSSFREYHAALARGSMPPEVGNDFVALRRAAMLVGEAYEELGTLVKNRIIDRNMFLDVYAWQIVVSWGRLLNSTAFLREAAGHKAIFENFEWLTVMAQDWLEQHPSGNYPEGARRLNVHNPWPVPPMPATA